MFVFPDMNKSFNMYTALVQEFHRNGHQVRAVGPALRGEKTRVQTEAEVQVLRVKTLPLKNVPHFLKGLSNLFLPYQYQRAIKKYFPAEVYDLVVIPTPPITLVDLASSIKKAQGSKVYLMLRDIFPQNAVDLGFMKKGGLIYRYFKGKEKKLYQVADHIGCMSQGNIAFIKKNNSGVSENKLHELKNFQISYQPSEANPNEIRQKYDLSDKFVVVFGGNMGKPQQLENVLELAQRCSEYSDVVFLLLGEGVRMRTLEKEIEALKIKNIRIQGTIPKQDYQNLISVCDLGLISLHKDFTIPNIPSKTLDYFNVGLPVLASIDRVTDYNQVLEEAGAGLWSFAGDHEQFKKNFDTLYQNKALRLQMGKNGRKYFEQNLTPDLAYKTIIQRLNQHQ